MKNDKVIASIETQMDTDKKKKGFEIIDQHCIKCANCDKDLIQVIKVKESNEEHNLEVECPFCGDASFVYKVSGNIYMTPTPEISIVDNPVDLVVDEFHGEQKRIYSSYIRTKKNEA